MPDILAFIQEERNKRRPVVIQENATAATIANLRPFKVAKVALAAGNANAMAFAWQNPESNKILITRVIVDVTTAGGSATSVLDVDVVANATATADTIINGLDLDATGVTDHLLVAGTGVGGVHKADEKGGANDYVTGKILVANAASLVGNVYIFYTEV